MQDAEPTGEGIVLASRDKEIQMSNAAIARLILFAENFDEPSLWSFQ
jgi:hypothetical protein